MKLMVPKSMMPSASLVTVVSLGIGASVVTAEIVKLNSPSLSARSPSMTFRPLSLTLPEAV